MKKIIERPVSFIASATISLLIILFVLRIVIIGEAPPGVIWLPLYYIAGVAYDYIFILISATLFLSLAFLLKKFIGASTSYIIYFYLIFLMLFVSVSLINVGIVKNLGNPLNYQWLYYSDYLKSADAKSAIIANVGWVEFRNLLFVFFGMFCAFIFSTKFVEWLKRKYKPLGLILFFLLFSTAYIFGSLNLIRRHKLEEGKVANPVFYFLESLYRKEGPKLGKVGEKYEKITFIPEPKTVDISRKDTVQVQRQKKVKNIILFILESTAVEYVGIYNSHYPTSPVLKKYADQSTIFTNAYVHTPATNKSLFSILASVYSWLSYKSLIREYPEVDFPTLNKVLKKNGYATSYFNSGMNHEIEDFVENQNFDIAQDYKDIKCNTLFKDSINEQDWFKGVDETCTVKSLTDWINTVKQKPFFSLVWTIQTHYPYFYKGEEELFNVKDKKMNRYLNGIKRADKALGDLLLYLEKNGLAESTLVMVTADHGEAFGEHGLYGHASRLFEENVHVPLILINKELFNGEKNHSLCGLKDIAPTILNLLNFTIPVQWQGVDLFSKHKQSKAFFAAPYSDFLVGFKEGNMKYILNTTKNSMEIYNLKTDPDEFHNLSPGLPKETEKGIKIINGWIDYQDTYMKKNLPVN